MFFIHVNSFVKLYPIYNIYFYKNFTYKFIIFFTIYCILGNTISLLYIDVIFFIENFTDITY